MYSFVLGKMFCRYLLHSFGLYSLLAPVFLFSFCVNGLSIDKNGVLMSPTLNVRGSMCDLSFSGVSFTDVFSLGFMTWMWRTELSFWWTFYLMSVK